MSISQRVGKTFGRFRRRQENPAGAMTLMEHLGELRTRIIISFCAVMVGATIGWFLFDPVFNILRHPYCQVIALHPSIYPFKDPSKCALAYSSVIGPFLIKIKVISFLGLMFASPVVLYQLFRFVTPGLTGKERRYAIPFVVASVGLFLLGAVFAYYTLPKALNFLLGFAGTQSLVAVLDVTKYLTFYTFMVLAFGLSFEFPVALIALVLVGILNSQKLRKSRRGAIVGIAVFAAVITPTQDWFTMTAMMVPMIIFYEISILIARFVLKK